MITEKIDEYEYEIEDEYEDKDEIEYEDKDEIENEIKPFDTKSIKISSVVVSLESLVKRLKYNEIDLNPDFQRNSNLWNRNKMSRLIESIILRLPLPIFYFDVSDTNKWIVIDGLQRLSTIQQFIVDNKFKLVNMEFLKELEGKNYTDLDRNIQRIIEETQIITYQMEPQTPKEVRYSIFNRINTGGITLNPQEIRQALNQKNNGVNFLKEVVDDKVFKEIVRIRSKRMIDRELVLRFIAFKISDFDYFHKTGSKLSTYLDNAMEKIDSGNLTEFDLNKIKNDLFETLKYLAKIFNREVLFNKKLVNERKTATLNKSLFEIWTVSISNLNELEKEILLIKKNKLLEKYKDLLNDSTFEDSITIGTNDRKAVIKRFDLFKNMLQEVLHD